MRLCASSSNRPSRIANRFERVFATASRLKRRIHRAVIGFLIRSKAPIVSSCARESKIDGSNSLFSERARAIHHASRRSVVH